MYKKLVSDRETFSLKSPNTIVPIPSNNDYASAYIVRYFIQRASDINGFVYEISQSEYEAYLENPYWIAVSMRWRISGPLNMVYDFNGNLVDKGVIESNKSSLSTTSLKIKNISLYLPNLKQFYK
jgi:hypothetical protein